MKRSRMITVLKRDGSLEPFTPEKLRAALMRVLPEGVDSFGRASVLTSTIECYLLSHGPRFVSSGALLEIALAALRAIHLERSARQWEQHHSRRWQLRRQLVIHHNSSGDSDWSKNWLVSHLCAHWSLGRPTARVLAGQVEQQLMPMVRRQLARFKDWEQSR